MRPWPRMLRLSAAATAVCVGLSACGGGGGGDSPAGPGADGVSAAEGGEPAATWPTGTRAGTEVTPCALDDLPGQALAELNAVRLQAQTCRGTRYPAVAALRWDNRLAQAAAVQAADMAVHDYVDHSRPGGSTAEARLAAAGYPWAGYTENVAGGPSTVAGVVAGWLASTKGHCENLMDARLPTVHMGLACYRRPGSYYTTYWALVTARPQR